VLRGQSVWPAILPTGAILTLNAYYASQDLTSYILVYLAASLLLLVTTHLNERLHEWGIAHVQYASNITAAFLRNGLIFSLGILVIAWTLPARPPGGLVDQWLKPVTASWHSVQREWGRMFNALRYRPGTVIPTFGRTLHFRGAPHLNDTPYFIVHAREGRYWRSAVYDTYRHQGWDETLGASRRLEAYETIALPEVKRTLWVTQTVTSLLPGTLSLIAAPNPVRFSVPLDARVLTYPKLLHGQEFLLTYAQQTLPQGTTYSVVSLIPDPDAPSLRDAGQDYPHWIREHYLQLPDDFPPRVRELAHQIAGRFDNPYDQAKALEGYLRGIPYSEEIPSPPPNQDGVAWFLFQQREGYCDYYASAMAVMARSLGIPARVASGYTRGVFDAKTHTWTIRESDAHTWPELWFPGYGWIPFEPTPSEPPLERPERLTRSQDESALLKQFEKRPEREPNPIPGANRGTGGIPSRSAWLASIRRELLSVGRSGWSSLFVALTLGFLLWQERRYRRRRLVTYADLPQHLYVQLVRWGRRLGVPLEPFQTPGEHLRVLSRQFPGYRPAFSVLVGTYRHALYAPPAVRQGWRERREFLVQQWEQIRSFFLRTWVRLLLQRSVRYIQGRFPNP